MSDDDELRKIRDTLVQILGEMRAANDIAISIAAVDDRVKDVAWAAMQENLLRMRGEEEEDA